MNRGVESGSLCATKRGKRVGILCVKIYDDVALNAWTQMRERKEKREERREKREERREKREERKDKRKTRTIHEYSYHFVVFISTRLYLHPYPMNSMALNSLEIT